LRQTSSVEEWKKAHVRSGELFAQVAAYLPHGFYATNVWLFVVSGLQEHAISILCINANRASNRQKEF
jgi:hypothetical protein